MDPKALYWTGALVNLGLIVMLAFRGVAQIREGEVEKHRRSMLTGALLIGVFLVSYVFKLIFLGREDLSVWSNFHVQNLRLHETCVLLMILAGGMAVTQARRMRGSRERTRNPAGPPARASTVKWHRRAGWTAVLASVAAFLTAAVILAGMYARLPSSG
jgi:uncharacterized membrane protein YozB (DUF420 family)